MSADNPMNGTAVPTATPTVGIEELANKTDNTRNDDPPVDVSNVPLPGPGKALGGE